MKILVFLAVAIHLIFPPSLHAAGRTARPLGSYLAFHGDPAPSAAGANLAWNMTNFLRLHGGVGGYHQWLNPGNWAIGFANHLWYGLAYSIVWMFTGSTKKLRYGNFSDKYFLPYLPHKRVLSYGGGATLLVPGLSLSPTIGASYSLTESKGNPYGLSDKQNVLYYSAGIDWQAASGFNFASGFNICPSLSKGACGLYVNAGFFF